MRMTIDEANRLLEELEMAKEIMQKYQKIEQIVKETDDLSTIKCSISFGRIKEVVENGSN